MNWIRFLAAFGMGMALVTGIWACTTYSDTLEPTYKSKTYSVESAPFVSYEDRLEERVSVLEADVLRLTEIAVMQSDLILQITKELAQ